MADNKTDYLENAVLNHILRGNVGGTAYTQPSAIYIGLFTSAPSDLGGGTEVSTVGTGYVRQQITFSVPSAGQSWNTNDIVFPKSTTAWGTCTHFAMFDALSGGNMLFYGPLSSSVAIDAANKKVEFEVNAISIQES